MAYQRFTKRTLTSAWKNLWPVVMPGTEIFGPERALMDEIISLDKFRGLDMDESDINEFI